MRIGIYYLTFICTSCVMTDFDFVCTNKFYRRTEKSIFSKLQYCICFYSDFIIISDCTRTVKYDS